MQTEVMMMMMRGSRWRYPDRKRCMTCRQYFGLLVVGGLFDSYACAGQRDPNDVPVDEWPREHYVSTKVAGRVPKTAFASEQLARRAARIAGKNAYVCTLCQEWHIGRKTNVD